MKKSIVLVLILTLGIAVSFAQKTVRPEIRPEVKGGSAMLVRDSIAVTDGVGVFLRWSTANEKDVIGFYVFREGVESEPIGFVQGGYLRSRSPEEITGEYRYFDPLGSVSGVYRIETVELNGKSSRIGPIVVDEVKDVALFAGVSSREMMASAGSNTVDLAKLEIPGDLEKTLPTRFADPDPVTQRWVAAQPGVKILVRQQGLYRVTRTQLQNAGFDLSGPSSRWQLYVEGRQVAITVAGDESYLEFYGEGMNSIESDVRAYFLVNGPVDGKRMGARVLRPVAAPVASNGFSQAVVKLERGSYISGILNGAEENFFGSTPVGNSSALNYAITLPAIDYSVARSSVRISLQGLTVNPHNVEVSINGVLQPTTISFAGQSNGVGVFEIDTSLLNTGANTIAMRGLAGSNDFSMIESVSVSYSRKFEVSQNQMSFYTVNYKSAKLTGFSSPNVRLFDTADPDNPIAVAGPVAVANGPSFDLTVPSGRARVLFAVEDSAVKAPVSVIRNFPSTLGTPQNQASMILVTHRDLMADATTWANYRSAQGTSTVVVDVADIFDEYSYGIQRATAMSEFFQYAKNNWQTAPNYILLFGDASYDPKNYGNTPFTSFVPTELVDTLYEETGSDEALCDFNDDGLAEIAIGRVPVRNSAEAAAMLAKTTQFEANLTDVLNRGALFVADQPIGYDFEGVNNRVSQQLPAGMPKAFVSRNNADARTQLIAELNTGKYLVNYSGHGSTLFWAASNFYHRNDLASMTNTNNYSIFTLLTCLNGYFVFPALDSFAEAAVKTPDRGAVIAWASSGKTTPDIQEVMATRFYNQIGIGNITRIGDLVRDAKQNIIGGRDVRLSWTLFGDPATKVR